MRPFNAAFEQRPEVLQPVRVNHFIFDVGLRMVNEIVHERRAQAAIPSERIRVQLRSRFNVFVNDRMQRSALAVRHNLSADGKGLCCAGLTGNEVALVSKLPNFTEIEVFFLMSRNELRLPRYSGDNSFILNSLTKYRPTRYGTDFGCAK